MDGLHPCTTTCNAVTNAVIKHNKYTVNWEGNGSDKKHEVGQQENEEVEPNPAS